MNSSNKSIILLCNSMHRNEQKKCNICLGNNSKKYQLNVNKNKKSLNYNWKLKKLKYLNKFNKFKSIGQPINKFWLIYQKKKEKLGKSMKQAYLVWKTRNRSWLANGREHVMMRLKNSWWDKLNDLENFMRYCNYIK